MRRDGVGSPSLSTYVSAIYQQAGIVDLSILSTTAHPTIIRLSTELTKTSSKTRNCIDDIFDP
jgi:hypothetical protein